jgi:hypothetical protein
MSDLRTISIEKYYSSLPNMLSKYERFARRDYFKGHSVLEFEAWRDKARNTLWELLGLDRMDSVSLKPSVLESVVLENGIVRRKVLIQTEEEVWVPMYLLIPDKRKGTFIAPPGHQGAGKYSIVGMREIPAVNDAIDKFNYDYGLQLAKMGFAVVCPDCRGFGERRDEKRQGDEEDKFLTSSCFHLAHMAEPLGETVIGMCTWDLMRIIDYIESEPELADENLSCLGFSGGGMQTLYLCALDERIKNVIISGYMYGFKDSLMILNGNCSCNYVPHLWEHFDMGDIGSLIAPRNLMIQSCREDHLNGPRGLENVYSQMEVIREAYRLYGKSDLPVHDICEGGHRWHDEHLEEVLGKFGLL